jgi:hypothetical protein
LNEHYSVCYTSAYLQLLITEALLSVVISMVLELMPNFTDCFSEAGVKKMLSLQLDSQLSWKPHISFILHKMNSVCFVTRRLSPVLKIQTLRTLYFAHFALWLIME